MLTFESGNSIQTVLFGRPFIPAFHKSDNLFLNRPVDLATNSSEHTDFLFQQHRVALLTLKIFDTLYSINKPDISEVKPLQREVDRSLVPTNSSMLDTMCQTSPISYIRAVDTTLHYYLLTVLIHRPWAARGFRDPNYHQNSSSAQLAARKLLSLVISINWTTFPQRVVLEIHLRTLLVRAALHALSMQLVGLYQCSQSLQDRQGDIGLLFSAIARCEVLASPLSGRLHSFFTLFRRLGERVEIHMAHANQSPGPPPPRDINPLAENFVQETTQDQFHDSFQNVLEETIDWPAFDWDAIGLGNMENMPFWPSDFSDAVHLSVDDIHGLHGSTGFYS